MAVRFVRYELRTLDLEAARAFYASLFGADFWGPGVSLARLPEPAIARGAVPHWLGYLGAGDVEGAAERLVGLGAQRLGPTARAASSSSALLRDPFGAIVAVTSETEPAREGLVAFHVLHTNDHERALTTYGALFGWTPLDLVDHGPGEGQHRGFAWGPRGERAGSVSNAASLPGVHAQWLFFFPVSRLDERLAFVRAHGGLVLAPKETAEGDRVAACDDPQGAAFAMLERGGAAPPAV